MTNFEKWKDGMTVKDFIDTDGRTIFDCGTCPAFIYGDCRDRRNTSCADSFRAWANQEVSSDGR